MSLFTFIAKVVFGNPKQKPIDRTEPVKKFEIYSGNPVKAWHENQDVISGLQFSATMQLRTPLRVLKRHGEIHSDINTKPPKIEHEMWEGIWIPKAKNTWRELGLDIDEFKESTVATDIGPITVTQYLPFLISVREIIENNESIDSRINVMRTKPMTGSWKTYVDKHGGLDKIINQFFPRFIDTIPNLNVVITEELYKLGIVTPNKLETSSDDILLAIKGIGKAKLKTIRYYCAEIRNNRDEIRQEKVSR